MNCVFELMGPQGERWRHECRRCGKQLVVAHNRPKELKANCGSQREAPGKRPKRPSQARSSKAYVPGGSGTELTVLIKAMGGPQGCQMCNDLAREMNVAGTREVRERREYFAGKLAANAKKHGWATIATTAWGAFTSGLAFRINPMDPFVSLIDEACRLADAKKKSQFVTTQQLVVDARHLAEKLPHNTSGIVGVARSGVIPASLIATQLHLPLWIFRQSMWDIISAGHGWRLSDVDRPGPLVFVDDTCMTGNSIRQAREIAAQQLPGKEVLFSVVYRNPQARNAEFDLWARDLPSPHLLEWNLFNSIHLPKMAFDFDGILTRDGTAAPQYLPRRLELKLIVTGRSEKLRAASEHWLARWGISVKRMIMWQDGPTPGDPLVIARWKAQQFMRSSLHYYVESCPIQAQEIARQATGRVICPAAGKVF